MNKLKASNPAVCSVGRKMNWMHFSYRSCVSEVILGSLRDGRRPYEGARAAGPLAAGGKERRNNE
jgi:hypothetical protein